MVIVGINKAVFQIFVAFSSETLLRLTSRNAPPCAVCVRMARWCAPSFPVQFMSPGVPGAPAQLHVSEAGEPGHAAARTQRAPRPVPKSRKQKSVICHRVQVGQKYPAKILRFYLQVWRPLTSLISA